MSRLYKKRDILELKDINNIKIILNYLLAKEGFGENLSDLPTNDLLKILNRESEITKLIP